ncbi:MAG TPA: vWA domain-containing protein, partial [Thermoanaerobaculia bacterium]|nr:vWA domain-containing protein [Thermoanaerobaculia bacterium]
MSSVPSRPFVLPALLVGLLLALTARPALADLDVAFVLDTTGSMTGELAEAQQRLRQLAAALAQARTGERVRFGVVAFRDRGDAYVTRVSQLTAEIGTTDAFLDGLDADGGGDDPESVLAGVMAALRQMDWDRAPATERRVVLVGDAPAHLDYADEPRPEDVIAEARRAEIV